MPPIVATGSNDPAVDKAAHALAESEKPSASPVVTKEPKTRKKAIQSEPKTPVVTAEEVEDSTTLFTKLLGMFLPDKTPVTAEEKDWIGKGAKGTFRKYPQVFEYFPIATLILGLGLFVWRRLKKKVEPSENTAP